MSGIQVLLHWLWEQEDKWRCAALYFHVRILFFHLIGLSSHSMWCRQRGNRKWKRRMDRTGEEMKYRHGKRGGMRLDCWWSLMKHLTRHRRMAQTETLPNIHACSTYSDNVLICAQYDNTKWVYQKSKVPTAYVCRRREKKLENNSLLSACHPFPFICVPEWTKSEKPSCGKILSHSLSLLFLPVSSFILPCHYAETCINIWFSNSKSLLWYLNMAEKWQCYKLCSSYVLACVQLSMSTVWGEKKKSKCRKLGEWGWRLIMTPTGGCSKELRSDTRCAGFVAFCFNLA